MFSGKNLAQNADFFLRQKHSPAEVEKLLGNCKWRKIEKLPPPPAQGEKCSGRPGDRFTDHHHPSPGQEAHFLGPTHPHTTPPVGLTQGSFVMPASQRELPKITSCLSNSTSPMGYSTRRKHTAKRMANTSHHTHSPSPAARKASRPGKSSDPTWARSCLRGREGRVGG